MGLGALMGIVIGILVVLAVIGWITAGIVRLMSDQVATHHMACPLCPHNIEPGDRVRSTDQGFVHLYCL